MADPDRIQILEQSKDGRELQNAALSLARSKDSNDHQVLQHFLKSSEFLTRLDSEDNYLNYPMRMLRIKLILKALANNSEESAQALFVSLTQDAGFCQSSERVDFLIEASASVHPVPPQLVDFWDQHFAPCDGYTPLTIAALIENRSDQAMELLEKKMADPAHSDEDKRAWMRGNILTYRIEPALLNACYQMVTRTMPQNLRENLLEVLFDYRPQEWYNPTITWPEPPDWYGITEEGKQLLHRLGEFGLKEFEANERLKSAIKSTLALTEEEEQ